MGRGLPLPRALSREAAEDVGAVDGCDGLVVAGPCDQPMIRSASVNHDRVLAVGHYACSG